MAIVWLWFDQVLAPDSRGGGVGGKPYGGGATSAQVHTLRNKWRSTRVHTLRNSRYEYNHILRNSALLIIFKIRQYEIPQHDYWWSGSLEEAKYVIGPKRKDLMRTPFPYSLLVKFWDKVPKCKIQDLNAFNTMQQEI